MPIMTQLTAVTEYLSKLSGKSAPTLAELLAGAGISRTTAYRLGQRGDSAQLSADHLIGLLSFLLTWYKPSEKGRNSLIGGILVALYPELGK